MTYYKSITDANGELISAVVELSSMVEAVGQFYADYELEAINDAAETAGLGAAALHSLARRVLLHEVEAVREALDKLSTEVHNVYDVPETDEADEAEAEENPDVLQQVRERMMQDHGFKTHAELQEYLKSLLDNAKSKS